MFGDYRVEDSREPRILLKGVGGWRYLGSDAQCERWCWRIGSKQGEELRGGVFGIWHYIDMWIVREGRESSEDGERTKVILSTLLQRSSSKRYSEHDENLRYTSTFEGFVCETDVNGSQMRIVLRSLRAQ